jgi:hypothetical protein
VAELHHSELYGVRGLLGLQQAHGRLLQQSGILVVFRKAEAVVLAVVLGCVGRESRRGEWAVRLSRVGGGVGVVEAWSTVWSEGVCAENV